MLGRLLIAGFAAFAAGCQTVQTTQPGAVGVERQQSMALSPQQVNASAEKAYQQVLAEASKKNALNRDAALVERVRGISRRLIPYTSVFRSDAPGWAWEVNVISNKELNAWCMPGGKIAFYSGLIEKLKLTDDEIAAVMGHEIAHALREHTRERLSEIWAQQLVLNVISGVTGMSNAGLGLTGLLLDVTVNLPNSREHETEADRIGVELSARSGFDPYAAVTVWEKMGKQGGGRPPEILSTHPAPSTRIADLRVYAARVRPLYEAARQKKQ